MHKPVSKTILPNGLTLLVQPLPSLASVSVGLQLLSGSREESPAEAGLTHLIEHLLFQGTGKRSMRELSRVISAVGGQLDACTGRESMTLYTKVPPQHLGLALDVMADMIFNSALRPSSLAKEKAVITEEINMVDDTPDELIHDLFLQALWPNQGLGRAILGSLDNLNQFTIPLIKAFMQRYFDPSNMILAVAGKVSPARVSALAKTYFAVSGVAHADGQVYPGEESQPSQPLWEKRTLEQVHLCLGVKAFAYADPRRVAAIALSTILGGGANSRLFYEIRERRGLAYAVYSFTDFFRDTGLIGVYAACQKKNFAQTMAVIKEQIDHLVSRGVTAAELADVKAQLKGNLQLSLESSSSFMWSMLQQETYLHQQPSLGSVLKTIDQLTRQDLKKIAQTLFSNQSLIPAVLGPYPKKI